MKAIMVMFDSLNKDYLPPYGCDWVHAPNFKRLAERTVTFDNNFVGSLPCMPARRELHTGRLNFLHRCWGPIEPFDDSMPQILKESGVYTHLVSDHAHYWEDGGATYHTRYNTWEIARGQEGDSWKGEIQDPYMADVAIGRKKHSWRQDWVNRKYLTKEEDMPLVKTFKNGLEFINTNMKEDNWFLQIEAFDPHEPFFAPQRFKDLYKHEYSGPHFDWPEYKKIDEDESYIEHIKYEYASLLSMCDEYIGKVLDIMDENNMWKDTMLIVNTDHGFLLGEHGWWGKNRMPLFNEISNTPLFIWDPRSNKKDIRNTQLVQSIDLAPTLLDYFLGEYPKDMQGYALKNTISKDKKVRDSLLFGLHGGHINITDGRYVYMRSPIGAPNDDLFNYTLMPTHIYSLFSIKEMKSVELVEPFDFTKECKVMKIKAERPSHGTYQHTMGHYLFDLKNDQKQLTPIEDKDIEARLLLDMKKLMIENDCPKYQFDRYQLNDV